MISPVDVMPKPDMLEERVFEAVTYTIRYEIQSSSMKRVPHIGWKLGYAKTL